MGIRVSAVDQLTRNELDDLYVSSKWPLSYSSSGSSSASRAPHTLSLDLLDCNAATGDAPCAVAYGRAYDKRSKDVNFVGGSRI